MNKDILLKQIQPHIKEVQYFESIDSTNLYAKRIANDIDSNTLIIADEQTNGIGRYNRAFVSTKNEGIYMSIILKNTDQQLILDQVTMMIAVCVKEAVLELLNIELKIKWVNDLYLKDKKVCGILCQSHLNTQNQLDTMIMGIGLNLVDTKHLLPEVAAALLKEDKLIDKEKLVSTIINKFFYYYLNHIDISDKYKQDMLLLNKDIVLDYQNQTIKCKVIDVNQDGGLVLENKDKEILTIHSGEVAITKKSLKEILDSL